VTALVLTFSFIMLLALGVVLYAAFPDRGRAVSRAPWIGELVAKPVRWFRRLTHHDRGRLQG
jgi:hypothetical protein